MVRTASGPRPLLEPIRRALWAVDPGVSLTPPQLMEDWLRQRYAQPRFSLVVLASFATIGLLLVGVGVYGVLAYTVARQRLHHVCYLVSMVRTQIQLTEAQFEALKARAAAEGRSMADLVRTLVDESSSHGGRPTPEERRLRALSAIGRLGRKGPRDLSRRHDDYLAEAYR